MPVVNLIPMTTKSSAVNKPRRLLLAGAVTLGLLAVAAPLAFAETLTYDANGYVDSTARCTSPDVAVVFGSTESSRIAICKDSTGAYEYRGVRVRDGAKLIAPAALTSKGFVAESDGATYAMPEAVEGSLLLGAAILEGIGEPPGEVDALVAEFRAEGYAPKSRSLNGRR